MHNQKPCRALRFQCVRLARLLLPGQPSLGVLGQIRGQKRPSVVQR